MAKTIAIVGKQGPLFGNRASHTELEFVSFEDSSHWVRVSHWPVHDRADAMRACFDQVTDTVMRDGDFAGYAVMPCGLCEAGEPSPHNCGN